MRTGFSLSLSIYIYIHTHTLLRTLYMNKPLLYSSCLCRLIILISFNFWVVVRVVRLALQVVCRESNIFLKTSLHPSKRERERELRTLLLKD